MGDKQSTPPPKGHGNFDSDRPTSPPPPPKYFVDHVFLEGCKEHPASLERSAEEFEKLCNKYVDLGEPLN